MLDLGRCSATVIALALVSSGVQTTSLLYLAAAGSIAMSVGWTLYKVCPNPLASQSGFEEIDFPEIASTPATLHSSSTDQADSSAL